MDMLRGVFPTVEDGKKFVKALKLYLDRNMIGQEQMKEMLVLKIFKYLSYKDTSPLLIIGPSGSGKTYVMDLLRNCTSIGWIGMMNIMTFDASRLTPNGYIGDSCDQIISEWKESCKRNSKKVDFGIIYVDEFDKILIPNCSGEGSDVNMIVQYQFMNYLQGTRIQGVDTSKLLFVLGGAFLGLEEVEKKRKRQTQVGFSCEEDKNTYEKNWIREDLLKFGAQKEILGRITSIVKTQKLTRQQIRALLLHPQDGAIAKKRCQMRKFGINFVVDNEVIEWLVDRIVEEDLGARSVNNVLDDLFSKYEFEMLTNDYLDVQITKECLVGARPIFVKRENTIGDKSAKE